MKNGFGMNYLIPRRLAVKATPAALKRIDLMKAEA
ncbi:MAG: 50S ribosomal protein L9, partial [bacterium]